MPAHRRVIPEAFDGRELIVVRLSLRPMTAVDGTAVVDGHIRQAGIVFPFDSSRAIGLGEGCKELWRLQVNVRLHNQYRIVLHPNHQVMVVLEGLLEGIPSLQRTVRDIDLEGFCVRVNSLGDEVIMEACSLCMVCVDVDLASLAASTDLDNAHAGINERFPPLP